MGAILSLCHTLERGVGTFYSLLNSYNDQQELAISKVPVALPFYMGQILSNNICMAHKGESTATVSGRLLDIMSKKLHAILVDEFFSPEFHTLHSNVV